MELEGILRELEFSTGRFPRDALEAAIAQREAVTPHLLRFIEHARENAEHLDGRAEGEPCFMGHIYAMYLLAQFRERAAYPLIVRFFSLPGEISLDMTGDMVTEDLPNILASVACGDTAPIKEMVENPALNEWVRSAAVRAFLSLVAGGEMSREEAVAYYAELFRGKLERQHSAAWNSLATCACDLVADELREEIDKAFDDHLVESFFINREDVEGDMARDKERVREHLKRQHYRLIESTIQEMQWWDCFRRDRASTWKGKATASPLPRVDLGGAADNAASLWGEEPVSPVRSEEKPGRNDPCPCGSGKKYKRCCGGKAKREA